MSDKMQTRDVAPEAATMGSAGWRLLGQMLALAARRKDWPIYGALIALLKRWEAKHE